MSECMVCDRIELTKKGKNPYFVRELETGYVVIGDYQRFEVLQREYENTPQDPHAPLLESIGNGLVRVMLNAIDASDYSIRQLGEDFIRSSEEHKGNLNGFLIKLDVLRKVTASGAFGFTPEELEAYLEAYKEAGYPMVSHSEQYRQAYKPAYRIVLESIFSKEYP